MTRTTTKEFDKELLADCEFLDDLDEMIEEEEKIRNRWLRNENCGTPFSKLGPHPTLGMAYKTRSMFCGDFRNCSSCRAREAAYEERRCQRAMLSGDVFMIVVHEDQYRALYKRIKRAGGSMRRYPVRPDAITVLFDKESAAKDMQYSKIEDTGLVDWNSLLMLQEGKRRSGNLGAPPEKPAEDEEPTIEVRLESFIAEGIDRDKLIQAKYDGRRDLGKMNLPDDLTDLFTALNHAVYKRIEEAGGEIVSTWTENVNVPISRSKVFRDSLRDIDPQVLKKAVEESTPVCIRGVPLDKLLKKKHK